MASLPIEERLLHYFIAMGAQPNEPNQGTSEGLSLIIGTEKVHVAILKNEAFLQRGRVLESVLNLSSLRASVNQLYLAAPRLLGTAIDVDVFRAHGIGLLFFDDRRIEEALPAQSRQPQPAIPQTTSTDPTLVTELATLKSMYLEMERNITKLREDLNGFQSNPSSMPSITARMAPPPILQAQPQFAATENQLPSFFSNNPWLEVLSKRGREENGPIAG